MLSHPDAKLLRDAMGKVKRIAPPPRLGARCTRLDRPGADRPGKRGRREQRREKLQMRLEKYARWVAGQGDTVGTILGFRHFQHRHMREWYAALHGT